MGTTVCGRPPQLLSLHRSRISTRGARNEAHSGSSTSPWYLADKIVALGGEPTSVPEPVPTATTNKQMVEEVLAAERGAIARYTAHAQLADEMGEKGLAVQLEDMVRDEAGHADETERILRDWPL